MKINSIKGNVVFKSGYPTFGTNGHLSKKCEGHGPLHCCYKPTDIPVGGLHIDYKA